MTAFFSSLFSVGKLSIGQIKLHYFLFFVAFQIPTAAQAEITNKSIFFYSEKITIEYNSNMVIDLKVEPKTVHKPNQKGTIQTFYESVESSDYQTLLNNLINHKNQLNLNDWFFYELTREAIHQIYWRRPALHKRLAIWTILAKAGYDVRLTYLDGEVFVNAFTNDEIYEVPIIVDEGKNFINLTSIHNGNKAPETLYISDFVPNQKGNSFSFEINDFPNLKPQYADKTIHFEDRSARYSFNIQFDRNIVNLMKNYPFVSEDQYVTTSFSPVLSNSILPILSDILEGKSTKEALEILVAFTRKGFKYKTDEEVYGRSRPMISEEIFHYHFSDCEDRSALFFNLVKELLNLPIIVIAYDDHVTVAVAAEENLGDFLFYKGKKYYLCDPTGPSNSYEIGIFPEGYENQTFEVIAKHSN